MNILPKWAMMFSVCIPIIGQLIFLYVVYNSYLNLLFIRPETSRTFIKDCLLILLTFGFITFLLIPLFFREVRLGGERMDVVMPNYFVYSVLLLVFFIFGIISASSFGNLAIWGFWSFFQASLTFLFITPFENVQQEFAPYM